MLQFGQIQVSRYGRSSESFMFDGKQTRLDKKGGLSLRSVDLTVDGADYDTYQPLHGQNDKAGVGKKRAHVGLYLTPDGQCLIQGAHNNQSKIQPEPLDSPEAIKLAMQLVTEASEEKGFSHYERQQFLYGMYASGIRGGRWEIPDLYKYLSGLMKNLNLGPSGE